MLLVKWAFSRAWNGIRFCVQNWKFCHTVAFTFESTIPRSVEKRTSYPIKNLLVVPAHIYIFICNTCSKTKEGCFEVIIYFCKRFFPYRNCKRRKQLPFQKEIFLDIYHAKNSCSLFKFNRNEDRWTLPPSDLRVFKTQKAGNRVDFVLQRNREILLTKQFCLCRSSPCIPVP